MSNDRCDEAIQLTIGGGPEFGTTLGATSDELLSFCGTPITAPGVWYSVDGSGLATEVRLCEGTGFDTQVSVFQGSCENLVCIGGNDDFCGVRSVYGWDTEVGVTYYILVSVV